MRRLPVYLLLDVSGSMLGEPIEAVKNGVQMMHSALRKDPYALESAFISVITFESKVSQVIPLTEVAQFQPPSLNAGGGTSLGTALQEVVNCANREVAKSTPEQKGDWKPLVFIMTDGAPTDNVEPGIAAFMAYKWGIVVACAAGQHADESILKRIAGENVVKLDTADSSSIAAFFKWVSSSISAGSKKIDEGGSEAGSLSELPPPPPEINLVK
ncbi:MAG TPA: tellurium resistance protein TerY [Planctomycetaceae bacterium]|nr:tellurium resistance protein TerY [Planctomycetaceae bacterium]